MAEFYRRFRCRTPIPGAQESGRGCRMPSGLRSLAEQSRRVEFGTGTDWRARLFCRRASFRHLEQSLEGTKISRVDRADDVSCRPDFTVLVYPAYIGTPDFETADDFFDEKRLQLSSYRPKTTLGIFPARLPTTASYLKGESKWNCIRSRPAVMAMDCVLQRIQFLDGKIFAAIGC